MSAEIPGNQRPLPDAVLSAIADYIMAPPEPTPAALETAHYCLLDSLACAMLALKFQACVQRLGPIVPGAELASGVPIPGTAYRLDPVQAAFNIGTQIRWLDFNDTWLAAECGHPSDNLGAILAVADYVTRSGGRGQVMEDVWRAAIQAHEVQGVLALDNSFNREGLDHVLLVRVASAAVATGLLGGTREQVLAAVSNAWADGGALRVYRHAPNTGARKSWAAGDATSRGVWTALRALRGEMGYPGVLSTPTWGFQDALMGGKPITLARPLGAYVMENVLFKLSFPAEFHAQTAVECAFALHGQVHDRLDEIERVEITTHESAMRIINKTGPLHNPADRDHCLQYMTAIGLIHGTLTAAHYEDQVAADPRIDRLRERMVVIEDPAYSRDYLDPAKRSIANAVRVVFRGGVVTERVAVEYPVGHRRRRAEGIPILMSKFRDAVGGAFPGRQAQAILAACEARDTLARMPVPAFMDCWVPG